MTLLETLRSARRAPESKGLRKADEFDFFIPCLKGGKVGGLRAHVYYFGSGVFAFVGMGRRLRKRLLELPGVTALQTGEEEFSVLFDEKASKAVLDVVQPLSRFREALGMALNPQKEALPEPRNDFEGLGDTEGGGEP